VSALRDTSGGFFFFNVPGEPAIKWETSNDCWLKLRTTVRPDRANDAMHEWGWKSGHPMMQAKNSTRLLLWIYRLLLSIYSALVIVSVNAQQRGFSWPIKARRFYVLHYYPHAAGRLDDNYGVSVTAFC
jgi:hypothetical protein